MESLKEGSNECNWMTQSQNKELWWELMPVRKIAVEIVPEPLAHEIFERKKEWDKRNKAFAVNFAHNQTTVNAIISPTTLYYIKYAETETKTIKEASESHSLCLFALIHYCTLITVLCTCVRRNRKMTQTNDHTKCTRYRFTAPDRFKKGHLCTFLSSTRY